MTYRTSTAKNSGEWVVLATFSWLQDALLLRSRLEASGIAVQIPEEHTASINPLTTVMQVRVLVAASDLERAKELLDIAPEESAGEDACPSCGSTRYRREGSWLKNVWMVLCALLFSVPVRKAEKKVCAECGRFAA